MSRDARGARRGAPRARGACRRRARGAPARRAGERPGAPWGSFPLSELVILLGIVLILWGAARGSGGERMLAAGLVIASLGGGELALREHMAGYRSHSSLLAGVAAFVAVTVVALGLGPVQVWVLLVLGVARLRRLRSTPCASCSSAAPGDSASDERAPHADHRAAPHHAARGGRGALARLLPRTCSGCGWSKQTVNDDDRERAPLHLRRRGRHAGDAHHLPRVPGPRRGQGRPRLDAPLRARRRTARRSSRRGGDYLVSRGVSATTEVLDRTGTQVDLPTRPGRPHRRDRDA